ncbi:hypothetical protein KFE25_005948 [Diacronema lutheri]|uniref:Phosphatidic acid phosphatase type 2/haloperoxidase domain-containing protein n=1 Tax=Diacronema lutheri TaxID=2081491 RepID=A0A8J6CJ33_DIALT|nr:hypothetical protein KFE25_005948 [Diacronema lutheri]
MGAIARPPALAMIPWAHLEVQAMDDSVRTFAAQHFALAGGVAHDSLPGLLLSSLAPIALLAAAGASAALIANVPEQQRGGVVRCSGVLFGVHTLLLLPLVELGIKPAVHRLRPDVLHHHSFSFPSGHTTSATYVSGALLFVLLPRLVDALAAARPNSPRLVLPPRPALVGLWLATSLGTALGRVLADAHWFTDTVAGALLGAVLLGASLPLLEPGELADAHASASEADLQGQASTAASSDGKENHVSGPF